MKSLSAVFICIALTLLITLSSCQKNCKACKKNFSIGYRLCEDDFSNLKEYEDSVNALAGAGFSCTLSN